MKKNGSIETPIVVPPRAFRNKCFLKSAFRSNASGTTWSASRPAGRTLPIGDFVIVKPGTAAAAMNDALARGKHLAALLHEGDHVFERGRAIAHPCSA